MAGQGEQRGIGFWFLPWLLSFLLTTFAIVKLVQYGIVERDLVAPLQAIADAYADGMEWLLRESGLEAVAHWLTKSLASVFGWEIELYDHWRHVFVLMSVWTTAMTRATIVQTKYTDAIITFVFGLAGSVFGAIIAGTVPQGNTSNEALIAGWSLFAWFALLYLGSIIQAFARRKWWPVLFLLFAGSIMFYSLVTGPFLQTIETLIGDLINISQLQSPGITALGLIMFIFAVFLVFVGVIEELFRSGGTYKSRLRQNIQIQLSIILLLGFVGAALIFAVDAAMKLTF